MCKLNGKTDLVVLPEQFTTGMSLCVDSLAENMDGETITLLKQWAKQYEFAIVGSLIIADKGKYYNRAFFITPDQKASYYDKRHLFRMADEDKYFEAGNERLIVDYLGWKICPLICYDLRFPVWSRNVDNEYDLLIYVANWPEARKNTWNVLLQARAIENMAYVCGVNRIGKDGKGFIYHGGSIVLSPRGETISDAGENEEFTGTCILKKSTLEKLRKAFPVWKDADRFEIH
jgi:predicted amidohydrolase